MSETSEELGALLARAKEAGPGPERLARVRARLESQVGPLDSPRAAAPSGMSPTAGALAIAVLTLIGLSAWLGTRAPSAEPSDEPVRAPEHRVVAPETEPTVDAPVAPTPTPTPEDEATLPTVPPPDLDAPSAARRAVRPSPSAPSEPPAEADPGSSLREEIALLDRALRASEAGDPARARAALDEHRARFPSGTLSPERDRMLAELAGGEQPTAP